MAALLVPLTFALAFSRWPGGHGVRESLLRGAVVLGLWVALAGAAVAAAALTRARRSPARHMVGGVEHVRLRDFGELSILRRAEPY